LAPRSAPLSAARWLARRSEASFLIRPRIPARSFCELLNPVACPPSSLGRIAARPSRHRHPLTRPAPRPTSVAVSEAVWREPELQRRPAVRDARRVAARSGARFTGCRRTTTPTAATYSRSKPITSPHRRPVISQIPPNHAESPSQGTRLGPKERASDQVRDQIQRVELRGFDSPDPLDANSRPRGHLRRLRWSCGR
jgi:hypothetical protein